MTERPSADPTLAVRFTGGDDVDPEPVLREAREDLDQAEARLALAEAVHGRQQELVAWLDADSENPRLLLTDPRAALRRVFPDLDVPEVTPVGSELVARLLRFREAAAGGVVVFTPPEVFAVQLLRDVADDAAARPTGYDELFADIRATVARVEGGRFGPDVIQRVVDGISRAHGLPVPTPLRVDLRPARSALAALLDEHPEARERLR